MFTQTRIDLHKQYLIEAKAKGLQLEAELMLKQHEISENKRYIEYLEAWIKNRLEEEGASK